MKLANIEGRAAVEVTGGWVDVHGASGGRFGPDVQALYDEWDDLRAWAQALDPAAAAGLDPAPLDEARLGAPAPRPRQVFAIGLNYRAHAEESGLAVPSMPATFTKYPASLAGPFDDVALPGDTVDWEVELVAVIGRRADRVAEADGWAHIAGVTVGQDLSERTVQFAAGAQFSLGKSFRGFGPMGPVLVSPDELADPDDLGLGCSIDGEVGQDARTSDLVFTVPQLVAELSAVLPLLPGDVVFTGTPAGVGMTRQPPRYLRPGEVLESWIEGIGTTRNRMVGEG
jgi:2-keto-4-pentenoate hydratase/2-oxohepta-3-ene-1,7-dioic acid hydratase in catechol pathway